MSEINKEYFNTECPMCGALFHIGEDEQDKECPQCGYVVGA